MRRLYGLESLVNLEVLWVNDNQLTSITHLDAHVRLQELYAHVRSGGELHTSDTCCGRG